MKPWIAVLLAGLMLFCTGCAGSSPAQEDAALSHSLSGGAESTVNDVPEEVRLSQENTSGTVSPAAQSQEEENMNLQIIANGVTFRTQLYDNPAAEAFREQLPLTLSMSELNGNEKYYYLPQSLPTDPCRPEQIQTGDLMLFGSDCLVLFYETFSTSYRYTPLGRVEDPAGLAQALGNGSVTVQFLLEE